MSFFAFVTAVAAAACCAPVLSQSVLQLSSARRDVGAAAVLTDAGVGLVVAGGCLDVSPGPEGPFSCANSSAAIEIYTFTSGAPVVTALSTLTVARGWPSVCSVGNRVIVAGGGTSLIKTASADVIDVPSATLIDTFPQALSLARWGIGCATIGDTVYFGGGFAGAVTDAVIDVYSSAADGGRGKWSPASFKLSTVMESPAAASVGDSLVFAGGWNDNLDVPNFNTLQTYNTSSGAVLNTTATLNQPCYYPGIVSVGSLVYVVQDAYLTVVDASGGVVSSSVLPSPIAGSGPFPITNWESGGAVTDVHIPQNGVALFDCLACYYGLRQGDDPTNAVWCFNTVTEAWLEPLNCTAPHKGGAFAGAGNMLFVAGGYDATAYGNPPNSVVDVFIVDEPASCAQKRKLQL